jgi:hypothetical protein
VGGGGWIVLLETGGWGALEASRYILKATSKGRAITVIAIGRVNFLSTKNRRITPLTNSKSCVLYIHPGKPERNQNGNNRSEYQIVH